MTAVSWKRELRHYFILLCVVGFGYYLFLFIKSGNDKKQEDLEQKYPFIQSITKDVRGVVIYNEVTSQLNNTNIVELNTNAKFRLTKEGRNYDLQPSRLQDFLIVGDSIVKYKGSDSLYIYRSNKEYCFLLGRDIGYKK